MWMHRTVIKIVKNSSWQEDVRGHRKTTVGRIRPAGLGLGTPGLAAGPLKRDMGRVIDKSGKENTQNE